MEEKSPDTMEAKSDVIAQMLQLKFGCLQGIDDTDGIQGIDGIEWTGVGRQSKPGRSEPALAPAKILISEQ